MNTNDLASTNLAVDGKPTRVRHQLALILMIILLVAYVDRVNVSVMIADPAFLADMNIANNPLAKGSLMSIFLICYGIGNIILSPIGDWLGPKKAMLIAITAWVAACVTGGLVTTLTMLLATRALLGFGEGLHYPLQSKFVKNWFPDHERGRANATWILGSNLAPMIAMPLFSVMIIAMGWRGTMFAMAVLGLIPIALLWFFTDDRPSMSSRINKAELEYIENALEKEREKEAQKAQSSTWNNIKCLIGDYRFWLLVTYYSASTTIMWGTMAWLPSYLKEARGFSWAAMGTLASLPYIIKVIVTIIAGPAMDKLGRRAPFTCFGMYGAALFIAIGTFTTNNLVAAISISVGIGCLSVGAPALWSMLQTLVPSKAVGTGAGTLNGIANAVSAIAPLAIGYLITFTGSYVGGFMYLVMWAIAAGTAGLVLTLQKY